MKLYEKERPKTWDDVIGHEKQINILRRLAERGLGGRAFWISGASGIGKTTIAHLLAAEIATEFYTFEVDASSLTPARLRELEQEMAYLGGRAFIINEAHGLRKDTIRRLLDLLERLPEGVLVVFTTTTENMSLFEDGLDSHPLLSRTHEIRLSKQGLAPLFAERAREIAGAEGLDGQPLSRYIGLVNSCKSNFRQVLQEIEKGVMLT
jgi:replication-associated recombination protein RarA